MELEVCCTILNSEECGTMSSLYQRAAREVEPLVGRQEKKAGLREAVSI